MVPLGAEILTERVSKDGRSTIRRSLRLGVQAYSAGEVASAWVLNISETGLLIETMVDLAVGETLGVDLPEAGEPIARVVWTEGVRAGCVFAHPIPSAAVSAARLMAPGAPELTSILDARSEPNQDQTGTNLERTVVLICVTLAVVALIVFLAAVLPL